MDARIGAATILAANVANGWSRSPQQDEARAEQLLFDSLGRDANSSAAHFAMGILRRVQNRLVDSRTEMEAAVGLDRNNAWAVLQLGLVLIWLGQPEEGIPHIEKAIRLNPHYPNIAVMYWALGAAHLVSGHTDQAIEFLTKARAANPGLWFIHQWLAGALV